MSSDDTISYDDFGRRFVALTVTPERVAHTLATIAGARVEIGPLNAGPADAATVIGAGRIDFPSVEAGPDGEWLSFRATLPVTLDLDVVVAGAGHHYTASLTIPLRLTVRTETPLNLVIDIEAPRARDIGVDLKAGGVRSRVLRRVGNIDREVRRHTARFVRERLESPAAAAGTIIELEPLIEQEWKRRAEVQG